MEGRTRGKLTRRWGHDGLGRPSPASSDGAVNLGAAGAGTSPLPRQRVVTAFHRCLSLRGSSSTILIVSTSMAAGVVLLLLGLVARDSGRARVRGARGRARRDGDGAGGGRGGGRARSACRSGWRRTWRERTSDGEGWRRACSAAATGSPRGSAAGVLGGGFADCVWRQRGLRLPTLMERV